MLGPAQPELTLIELLVEAGGDNTLDNVRGRSALSREEQERDLLAVTESASAASTSTSYVSLGWVNTSKQD
jgi:hypothetical protein